MANALIYVDDLAVGTQPLGCRDATASGRARRGPQRALTTTIFRDLPSGI